MTPMKYGASLVITMADDTTQTLTGSQAQTFAIKLDDLRGITKLRDEDTGVVTYYRLSDNGCGYCKLAVLTPTAEPVEADECEDGIPNCPVTAITINPTTASVEVGKTVKLIATTTPANQNVKWTTSSTATATVVNGVVTGVKAGTATITAADAATGAVTATATVTVTAAA